ncbi:lipid IV(A) palmitoyltransferase PagP [Serratia odorifera]|uniref:Lipid A acyltransferase PagP n=1 Tax=Serratia odorifera DSM 4582 TaxID=667129 RepID=D4DWI4_SEROD|nr:lipid IV(A) palmitoyltransferase PagP [Serratia odorifera]EFE98239.1 antimicrobial peptide resistance and lipid A acylation protein PagP [Serratia odorifera DSM 4582]
MMFYKWTPLACGMALMFSALPSQAEVGAENATAVQTQVAAENGAAAQTQAEAQNATAVQAEQPGLWQRFTHNVAETWNNSPNKDIYLPAITWHNRWTYDDEHIDKYNERPWGAGYGISRFDQDGDWHGIYLMAFKDSFNKWEPIGGYAYEKIWRPLDDKDFRLGLGFTASVTARDNWNYIPIPAPLPLASIGYKSLTFQATYIPGTYNNGNVFFAWLRWQF